MEFKLPTYASVIEASSRIFCFITRTPVLTSSSCNDTLKAEVYFKCENLQKSGSFKCRGAFNACMNLKPEYRVKGVCTFSSGNHALAMSMAAKQLGIPCIIVMPLDAPENKIQGTRDNNAEIVFYDRAGGEDREAICNRISLEKGMSLIPPFDHFDVIAGQGTSAKELLEEVSL